MNKSNPFKISIQPWMLLVIFLLTLTACTGSEDPEAVFKSLGDAISAGDVDAALSYLSDEANVFINPERDFYGKEEIRGWYEFLVADHTSLEISNFQTDGDICTWDWKVSGDGIKAGGNEYMIATMEGKVKDGKVLYYKVTGAK